MVAPMLAIGLVVVTAEGEVVDLAGPEVDPDGLDLLGLFVGSEHHGAVAVTLGKERVCKEAQQLYESECNVIALRLRRE